MQQTINSTLPDSSPGQDPRPNRGVNQYDVWAAADALLKAGQRPTIERVRQTIGRGSPNTVGPLLETWFQHLGTRLHSSSQSTAATDGGGLNLPGVPVAVMQAAAELWQTALGQARAAHAKDLEAAQAQLDAARRVAEEARHLAEGRLADVQALLAQTQAEAQTVAQHLEEQKIALARALARQEQDHAELDRLQADLRTAAQMREQLQAETERHREQAEERTRAAERRAALDMDRERTLRQKAEKRIEALEAKAEAFRVEVDKARRLDAGVMAQGAAELEQARRHAQTLEAMLSRSQVELAHSRDQQHRLSLELELASRRRRLNPSPQRDQPLAKRRVIRR